MIIILDRKITTLIKRSNKEVKHKKLIYTKKEDGKRNCEIPCNVND